MQSLSTNSQRNWLWLLVLASVSNQFLQIGDASSLPELAANLRVDSSLVYVNTEEGDKKFLKIEEFIARDDGSVRINVEDRSTISIGDSQESSTRPARMSYFRLLQGEDFDDSRDAKSSESVDNYLLLLDTRAGECRREHTSTWLLQEFSAFLTALLASQALMNSTHQIQSDRTAVGPSALLQLVYANAGQLKLDSEAYEELNMADTYYFSLKLDNIWQPDFWGGIAKSGLIVVAVLAQLVGFNPTVGQTLLSQVHLRGHPSMVALFVLDQPASSNLKSYELLDALKGSSQSTEAPLESLIIAYDSIQEHSLARHTGLESLSDELSTPFTLPPGIGCGSLSAHRPLYVDAKQFSGQFEAMNFDDTFGVAYDQATNHLRYDSAGEFKIVYSLDRHLATFISSSSPATNVNRPPPAINEDEKALEASLHHDLHENSEHCAQTNILNEASPWQSYRSALSERSSLADILGVGGGAGLMYLGRASCAPGQHQLTCYMFERELSLMQIPSLLGMHLRTQLQPNDRFFLVVYLVDELTGRQVDSSFDWQTRWLKRVDLLALDGQRNYQTVASSLSFSSFSWSLESVDGGAPVQVFDTLECWPIRGQLGVDFLAEVDYPTSWPRSFGPGQLERELERQRDAFEQGLELSLSTLLRIPRYQINQFRSQLAPSSPASDRPLRLLASFKLTKPFYYVYKRLLVGWVASLVSLLEKRQARVVKYKQRLTYHECASRLATLMAHSLRFHMLLCPNVGCAYLTTDHLKDVDYIATPQAGANQSDDGRPPGRPPQVDSKYYMCELHRMSKTISMDMYKTDAYEPKSVRNSLHAAVLIIDALQLVTTNASSLSAHFRAQVLKLNVQDGASSHKEWDEVLFEGFCFEVEKNKELKVDGKLVASERRRQWRFVQLDLDRHHSRAHCRMACLLYQFCQTYSYDGSRRRCILTEVHRTLLMRWASPSSSASPSGRACSISALDHTVLYERSHTSDTPTKMPHELMARAGGASKELIVGTHLGRCASLCHLSEFGSFAREPAAPGQQQMEAINRSQSSSNECLSFHHMTLKWVCVLDAYQESLVEGVVARTERLVSTEQFERQVGGHQELYEASEYAHYLRTYDHYFVSKYGFQMQLTRPEPSEQELVKTMAGLSVRECQRECSMLRIDCAMFDYCLVARKGLLAHVCHLYSIRSPFSLRAKSEAYARRDVLHEKFSLTQGELDSGSSLAKQLTSMEQLFYIEGQSAEHHLEIRSRNCDHYYLTGDHLALKRMLANQMGRDQQAILDASAERDELKAQLVSKLEAQAQSELDRMAAPDSRLTRTLCLIVAGLLIGSLVFMAQPRVARLGRLVTATARGSGSTVEAIRRRLGRERSMSTVDIVEMDGVAGAGD